MAPYYLVLLSSATALTGLLLIGFAYGQDWWINEVGKVTDWTLPSSLAVKDSCNLRMCK